MTLAQKIPCSIENNELIADLISQLNSKFILLNQEEDSLKYKVSKKETLILSLNDPKHQADYNFVITDLDTTPKVEFTGGIYQTENGNIKRTLKANKFQKELKSFKYTEQNVNHHLMLFGLSNEEIFVKGNLERWDRVDGQIIARANIKDLANRRKEWKKLHPSSVNKGELREYSLNECKKAQCIQFINDTCEFEILPNNNNKFTKLKEGTGYCEGYRNQDMIKQETKLLRKYGYPLIFTRFTYISQIITHFKKLKGMQPLEFSHYITKPFFSRKKFAQLIKELNKDLHKRKERIIKSYTEQLNDFKSKFYSITSIVSEFIRHKIENKAFKKLKKEFTGDYIELIEEVAHFLHEIKSLVKSIIKQNKLINKLFDSDQLYRSFSQSSLKEGMLIFFLNSNTKEIRNWRNRKEVSHYNVGRIKNGEEWTDINLSTVYSSLYGYGHVQERTRQPIYQVISVKKGYTELKPLFKNRIIRLLVKREYLSYGLKFKTNINKNKPLKIVSKQTNLSSYF